MTVLVHGGRIRLVREPGLGTTVHVDACRAPSSTDFRCSLSVSFTFDDQVAHTKYLPLSARSFRTFHLIFIHNHDTWSRYRTRLAVKLPTARCHCAVLSSIQALDYSGLKGHHGAF
jgi:hypothetical protein